MKKIISIIILLSLPIFIKAEENNYFDWEKIEVEELPTASIETTDKVYINENKYYITEITGGKQYLSVGMHLKGKTIYQDMTGIYECIKNLNRNTMKYTLNSSNQNFYIVIGNSNWNGGVLVFMFYSSGSINGNGTRVGIYNNYGPTYNSIDYWRDHPDIISYTYTSDDDEVKSIISAEEDECNLRHTVYINEESYNWKEVSKNQVIFNNWTNISNQIKNNNSGNKFIQLLTDIAISIASMILFAFSYLIIKKLLNSYKKGKVNF